MYSIDVIENFSRITAIKLKTGEIMRCDDVSVGYLLRVYAGYVSLTNPERTWCCGAGDCLSGVKLAAGSKITLTVQK